MGKTEGQSVSGNGGDGLLGAVGDALRQALRRLRRRRHEERELARLQRQILEETAGRDRMLAFISHELRTPLHGIIGLTGLLRNTPLNAEQLNYVQNLDASGRLLLSMVDELLEKARANALGATDVDAPSVRRHFDPVALVENVVEMLAPRAHARELEMACFIAPEVHGQWLGDALRIRQILLNLVGNAIKFTPAGGILVSVERDDDGLHFTVADTGPGVPPELERRLFAPFVRAAAHETMPEGGAGLGLAIVQQLVSCMDGRLVLNNVAGEGAIFHVHLPLQPVAEGEGAASPAGRGVEEESSVTESLHGARFHLMIPAGPVRRALERYIDAHGGAFRRAAPEQLPALLADATAEVIVDGRHADRLRAALYSLRSDMPRARLWLLLMPEERIRLHDLLEDTRIHGYLLRPLRRRTFRERLVGGQIPERIGHSVAALRQIRRQAGMPRQRECGQPQAPLVLVAEDDPVNAQIVRSLLDRAGYRVWRVDDGRLVLEWMRQALQEELERPVCILMDVHMPHMDGLEATEALRRLERELQAPRTPVVALSAATSEDARIRCLAAGMDGFLGKPFEPEELLEAVRVARQAKEPANDEGRPGA